MTDTHKLRNPTQTDIVNLHTLWKEQQRQCTKAGHREKQKQMVLNYGHIQVVYLCQECYDKGREEHNKYAREHGLTET